MKRINMELEKYPVLDSGLVSLESTSFFRIEGLTLVDDLEPIELSALMMFTGLMTRDEDKGLDYLHCVPIYFYGANAAKLSSSYKNRYLWIEILNFDTRDLFPSGYFN